MHLIALVLGAQDWRDPAWTYRRPIVVTAVDGEIPAGAVVEVGFDAEELGIADLALEDRADYRVALAGQAAPFAAEVEGALDFLWIRVPEAIPKGQTRRFELYYGNREAQAADDPAATFAADMAGASLAGAAWPAGWTVEAVRDALRVRAGPGRARVPLAVPAIAGPMVAELRIRGVAGAPGYVGLHVLPAAAEPGEELVRRIEALVADLGSDSWERREAAQAALVEIGRPAIPHLRRAAQTGDPEVTARARAALEAIEASLGLQDRWIGWRVESGQTFVETRVGEAVQRQPLRLGSQPWVLRISREPVPAGLNLYVCAGPVADGILVPAMPQRMPSDASPLAFELEVAGAGFEVVLVRFRAWPLAVGAQVEILPAERAP